MSTRRAFAKPLDLTAPPDGLADRFWSKVELRGPHECWPWTAYRKPNGYGQFTLHKGEFITASRASLALTIGRPLAVGEVACHKCDNPPCVNPQHLFSGTQVDNTYDSVLKGRADRIRGEAAPASKLTDAQVREIRRHPERYGLATELAQIYGVAPRTIKAARSGLAWGHVDELTNTDRECTQGHLLAGANLLPVPDLTRRTLCATCAEEYRVSRLVESRRAS